MIWFRIESVPTGDPEHIITVLQYGERGDRECRLVKE